MALCYFSSLSASPSGCAGTLPPPWMGWDITEQLKGLFCSVWLMTTNTRAFPFLGLGLDFPVPSQGTSLSPPALESWCC